MSEAIAMHRSGAMSKRAKSEANRRLVQVIWGKDVLTREDIAGTAPPKSDEQTAREKAAKLREYARMTGPRQAKKLIAQAEAIEASMTA